MPTPDLFEQLLATYPAEKRELARQVYCRFAEGDSTQFFTQLFMLLDIYAQYAEGIPQAVNEANQSAQANLGKIRDEIALLARMIDSRNLNIANHAETTDELCNEAIAKCNETISRFESLLRDIGTKVDTGAIVDGVQTTLQKHIHEEIILPFVKRTEELGKHVMPTLEKIRDAAAEAGRIWPERIWKVALTSSAILALAISLLGTCAIYLKMRDHYERKIADKIASAEQLINYNQAAFRQLAIAQMPVRIVRTESYGVMNPSKFALVVEGADSVEIRHVDGKENGFIFFTSSLTEKQIEEVQRQVQKLTQDSTRGAK